MQEIVGWIVQEAISQEERVRNLFKVIQNISEVTLKSRQWAKNNYWFISMQIVFMHVYTCSIYIYFL